jgi:hypothetical protein
MSQPNTWPLADTWRAFSSKVTKIPGVSCARAALIDQDLQGQHRFATTGPAHQQRRPSARQSTGGDVVESFDSRGDLFPRLPDFRRAHKFTSKRPHFTHRRGVVSSASGIFT